MRWRLHTLSTLTAMLFVTAVGCQTSSQSQITCGEGLACAPDPLIIFIGADRDVANMGRLPKVTEDFRDCGYDAVYFDPWKQLHDDELLAEWIRNAVRCRGRRVMLVGWSYGAIVGLKALKLVEREGIRVDTFVELDCFILDYHLDDCVHPSNADRVVVIRSKLNQPVTEYCRPAVHRLDSFWHLGVPTHEHTQCVLRSEANRIRRDTANEDLIPSLPEFSVSKSPDSAVLAAKPDGSMTAR